MPTIFGVQCKACGELTPTGLLRATAILRSDGALEPVPHPNELWTFARHGGAVLTGLRGRFVALEVATCADCGSIHERGQLSFPLFAVTSLLACFLGPLAVVRGLAPTSGSPTLDVVGVPLAVATLHAFGWLFVRCVPRRGRRMLPERCPDCSGALHPIREDSPLRCPVCRSPDARLVMIGVS